MKKLLVGLLAIGSLSTFAANCGVELASNNIDVTKAEFINVMDKELSKSDFFVVENDQNTAAYTLFVEPIQYHFDGAAPGYLVPVGIQASLYLNADGSELSDLVVEGTAMYSGSVDRKLRKLSKKALSKVLEEIGSCK